jgi:hypothetical protein
MRRERKTLRIKTLLMAGVVGLLSCCGTAFAQGTRRAPTSNFLFSTGSLTQRSATRVQTQQHPPNPNVTNRLQQWQTNKTIKYAFAHSVRVTPTGRVPAGAGGFGDGSNSAIIAILRRQSAAARSLLVSAVKLNQAHSAATGAALMNNNPKVGLNSAPMLGPSQTMSASGTQRTAPSTNPVATAATMPTGPLRPHNAGGERPKINQKIAERTATPLQICKGGIATVDGAANGVWFSPVLGNEGRFVIQGCGFGSTPGEVYLSGVQHDPALTKGMVRNLGTSMCPGCVYFRIEPNGWSDRQIVADIDPNASGLYDTNNVTLEVKTAGGQVYQAPGMNFLAARADQVLNWIVKAPTGFSGYASQTAFISSPTAVIRLTNVKDSLGNALVPGVASPSAGVIWTGETVDIVRAELGASTLSKVTFPGGSDTFQLILAPGFGLDPNNPIEMQHTQVDVAQCRTSFNGEYSENGNWAISYTSATSFQVSWQEEACWPKAGAAGDNPTDYGSVSAYALRIAVLGPRGIDPWAGENVNPMVIRQTQPVQLLQKN